VDKVSDQPIKNNSKMLYLQAKNQFEAAKKKFEDGTIKTETTLIQSVFKAFQDFFVSMGKPMMKPRFAPEGGPPWSEDYNTMMDEIKQDLELMYQEIDILGRSLYTDFNHNMVQHSIIDNEYEQVADKLKDLELLATNLSANGRIVFHRNDFVNKDKIDFDRIVGTAAHIENGVVTLQQSQAINLAESAQVTIIPGNKTYNNFIIGSESNGFPGNNHEVTVLPGASPTDGTYQYQFVGAKNNHSAYGAVLDGNPNTWFEYELVNIRSQDKQGVAKNLGFSYQVDGNQLIEWARDPEDGVLKLHMQIILNEVKYINNININMYTPPNQGAKTAIVKNILISDGQNAPTSVISPNKKDDDYTFHFTPRKAKVISILFEQPHKYYCDIGHIYYEQKREIEDSTSYVFDTLTKKTKPAHLPRIEGPMMSLQDIGVEVKVTDQSVDAYYPMQTKDNEGVALEDIIHNMTRTINNESIENGIERFEGWRYCIGIRDIQIFSCEYAKTGEIVTEPYFFDKPLEKITLSVNEDIPMEFYQDDPASKYKWIKYFVSIDDGATWYPITPLERQDYSSGGEPEPPKIYTIQKVDKASQKAENKVGYIESEYPVYSIRLRILFERPDEVEG
jgi:hypothetical protein